MKKLASLCLACALLLSFTSCGATKRFGKDVFITVTSPAVILYGAGTDTMTDVNNIQTGMDASPWVQPFFFPFALTYRLIDHTLSCTFYALDAFAYPFYGMAELNDFGPEIKPLMIYKNTIFDDDDSAPKKDAETGEEK